MAVWGIPVAKVVRSGSTTGTHGVTHGQYGVTVRNALSARVQGSAV